MTTPATSTAAPPTLGQSFKDRSAIKAVWGGDIQGGMATFPAENGSVVNIFSDEDGLYPDRRIPGTDRIEYVGQGLSGDQVLTARGQSLMERARTAGAACRYWHKATGNAADFEFESWVVIVGRRREWNRGQDGNWRRAYVYVLAPVRDPNPATWPASLTAELATRYVDDRLPGDPPDPTAPGAPPKKRLYGDLLALLNAAGPAPAGTSTRTAYGRSGLARQAVLLRADGKCENPQCAGMACDVNAQGRAILDVDHVKDLSEGGADEPWNMLGVCPNCHAAKTRGKDRAARKRRWLKIARDLHAAAQ